MTQAARFELFSYWRTSATYRVRVACNLKGVQPQEHNINLDAGEQRSATFLKINPMAAIPALIDHGDGQSRTPLTQSLAILEFLDESFPTPALLPADAHGRARVRGLAAMLAADIHLSSWRSSFTVILPAVRISVPEMLIVQSDQCAAGVSHSKE